MNKNRKYQVLNIREGFNTEDYTYEVCVISYEGKIYHCSYTAKVEREGKDIQLYNGTHLAGYSGSGVEGYYTTKNNRIAYIKRHVEGIGR